MRSAAFAVPEAAVVPRLRPVATSGAPAVRTSLDREAAASAVHPAAGASTAIAGRVQPVAVFVGSPGAEGAERVARAGGFAVVRVGDAASAEAVLSQGGADLVVLDGGVNGQIDFSACRRLASLRAGAILVLTGRDDEVDRVLALELGADDCIPPVCGEQELLARMRALARRAGRPVPPAGESHVLRFSGLRLDRARRELRRPNGERVPLSPSEYDLLCLFLANPARILTPDEIRTACKGDHWQHPRNVAVRVYRLRRRLQTAAGQDLIRTVHALGYVLECRVTSG